MANNIIIIPIHQPHFTWAIKLLDSAHPSENIALGFSNHNDANLFNHPFPFKKLISNVCDNEIGFIGKKKLNLLSQVYLDYDYISIIDAEAKFLRPVTICLEEIWNNNCFIANHSIDGARMVKELCNACGYHHTDDLYPWFNCMPIFKSELIPGFFNWLDTKKDVLNEFYKFEFLLFSVYCRYELNMPWRVLEGKAWHGLVENADEWEKPCNKHLLNQVPWSTYQKRY